jgi:F-type H+-transporting ATPase subunit alpha
VEILKQAQNDPYTVEDQVAIIYAGSKNLLREVPVTVKAFEKDYIETLRMSHQEVLSSLKAGKLTDEAIAVLTEVAAEVTKRHQA